MTRFLRDNEAQLDELGSDPGQVGPDTAGQSGDTQGLSDHLDAADESVEELADTYQAYEAGIVKAVEDADDHPERAVHTYGDHGRTEDIPPKLAYMSPRALIFICMLIIANLSST